MSRLGSDFQHAYPLCSELGSEYVCAKDSQWQKAWAQYALTET